MVTGMDGDPEVSAERHSRKGSSAVKDSPDWRERRGSLSTGENNLPGAILEMGSLRTELRIVAAPSTGHLRGSDPQSVLGRGGAKRAVSRMYRLPESAHYPAAGVLGWISTAPSVLSPWFSVRESRDRPGHSWKETLFVFFLLSLVFVF